MEILLIVIAGLLVLFTVPVNLDLVFADRDKNKIIIGMLYAASFLAGVAFILLLN